VGVTSVQQVAIAPAQLLDDVTSGTRQVISWSTRIVLATLQIQHNWHSMIWCTHCFFILCVNEPHADALTGEAYMVLATRETKVKYDNHSRHEAKCALPCVLSMGRSAFAIYRV
jgi:hypothetical protein